MTGLLMLLLINDDDRNRDNEPGIEMKVMHEDGEVAVEDMAASVEKAINEISGEDSMVSIENGNSIIGKRVFLGYINLV